MEVMKKYIIAFLAFAGISAGAMAADTPQYPGGEEAMQAFITENLQYPAPAKELGVEGVVNLRVTIEPDGSVGDVKVVRMVDPDLEGEAIRIVRKMPAWEPAEKDGQAVESTADVAVSFQL